MSLGTISVSSSIRFPANSGDCKDTPVMLPPGRDKLATKPTPTGSAAPNMTMGVVLVAFFAAWTAGVAEATIRSTFRSRSSFARVGQALHLSGRPSILDHNILAINPTEVAKFLLEYLCRGRTAQDVMSGSRSAVLFLAVVLALGR